MGNNLEIQHITLDQLNIAQLISGSGEPILLLHGWGANLNLIMDLSERLAKKGNRVYALDLPGFGLSDTPQKVWTIFDYADFIVQFMDYHQLEKVNLFGHSFGGRLSLILAAKHADRINKLVLCDSAGIKPQTPKWKQLRLTSYKRIRTFLTQIGQEKLAEKLRQTYNKRYGSSDFQQVSGIMRETFVNVINQDLLDCAREIKAPTLIFWGANDQDTPVWMAKKLESSIPDAGHIIYENVGH
ncbi:alpha/beta hydrolase [Anaerolineales bacterium]